ncbi:MAG TPA: hypothetical protein VFF14_03120 [Candidatus Deferrimicrobium sp.]|nr:hypothetical protein [Candidatus Deferrimicrobium sp.]
MRITLEKVGGMVVEEEEKGLDTIDETKAKWKQFLKGCFLGGAPGLLGALMALVSNMATAPYFFIWVLATITLVIYSFVQMSHKKGLVGAGIWVGTIAGFILYSTSCARGI